MSVETPSYGVSNWPLPSPTATPKSSGSQQLPFETPKAESPSFFADAYYTPSLTGQQTPILTPTSATTVVFRPASVKNSPLTPDDPKFHNNVDSTSKLPLPPVDPSKRLSSSPSLVDSSSTFSQVTPVSEPRITTKMNPFQMQTPPSGDGSKNQRGQPQQQPIHGAPFQPGQNSHSTPIRPAPMNFQPNAFQTPTFQTPFQNQVTISTDWNQFPNAPASAPAMPQARFMWDQSPQMPQFDNRMMPMNQAQFPNNHAMMGEMRQWQNQEIAHQNMQGNFMQQSPVVPNHPQESDFWISGNVPGQTAAASFPSEPAFVQSTTGVNPNLLFSFSSPVQTVNPSSVGAPIPPPTFDPQSRQPYEQQNRESARERELVKITRQQQQKQQPHSRNPSAVNTSNRPPLQRSNTDSGFRRTNRRSFDARQAVQAAESIQRKSSPLKRLSQVSLSSIPESRGPSKLRTRLIIDDSGTARTETVMGDDDDLPMRSSSDNWPGEDDSSEDDPVITSQRNSFIFTSDLLRAPKHARLDSDEDDDGGLYKRPLSSTSLSSLTARMGNTPLGRKVSMDAHRRLSQESFSSSLAERERELASSSQDTIQANDAYDSDTGDAQSALKKLVGGRPRRDFCDPNATIKPRRAVTNPVRSSGMIDITKFPSPPSPSSFARPSSNTNTPTTDRSNRSTDSTRCVCGVTEDTSNSPVIQCENCANYLHVRCVFGKRAEERNVKLPQVYVCAFCTGQLRPPSFYGDDNSGLIASPLGYKSGPFM